MSFQTGVAAAANQSGSHAFLVVPWEQVLQLNISDFRSWWVAFWLIAHEQCWD
ncbi:MAG TPA: hypothetical protein VEM96_17820 [Pyrinomonadaceae bacterium]|nr:hypothetical protein [Pyrinomonadaceae bacterium]